MHPWPKKAAALCLDSMKKEVQMKYKYLAGSDFASLHRNVNCRIEMRLRLTLTASKFMRKASKECKTTWGFRTLTLLQKVQITLFLPFFLQKEGAATLGPSKFGQI